MIMHDKISKIQHGTMVSSHVDIKFIFSYIASFNNIAAVEKMDGLQSFVVDSIDNFHARIVLRFNGWQPRHLQFCRLVSNFVQLIWLWHSVTEDILFYFPTRPTSYNVSNDMNKWIAFIIWATVYLRLSGIRLVP